MQDAAAGSSLSTTHTPWPSAFRANWLIFVLSAAYIISYLDRIVINLLIDPIQNEFGIGDAEFGALTGLAFGLFYTLMALPIGRLADTGPRRPIIAIGTAVFGICSMLSGLAYSYASLFMARVGVGAGEASLSPTAYSLISDSFPPERLGRAMAIFTLNAFLGIGLAYLIGGAVISWLEARGSMSIGPFQELEPWRLTFILLGLPALFIVPLVFTCKDPGRRGAVKAAPPIRDVVGFVVERRGLFAWMFAGFACLTFSGYASTVWSPAFLIRVHGFTPGEVGYALGLIYLICAPAGAFAGGWVSDHLTAKGRLDAPLRVAAWGYIGAGVFGVIAPLAPSVALAVIGLAVASFFAALPYPLAGTAIQLITPNRMRGQVSALYMTTISMVGLGLGPVAAGALTDFVFSDPSDVRYSLALINGLCTPLVFFFVWKACAPFRQLRAKGETQ